MFEPGEIVGGFLSLGSDPEINVAFAALTQALRQGLDTHTMPAGPHSPLVLIQDRLDAVLSSEVGRREFHCPNPLPPRTAGLPHTQVGQHIEKSRHHEQMET